MNYKRERLSLENGIDCHILYNDKFKSNLISLYFVRDLNFHDPSKNTLVPLVLRQGNKRYPNNLSISRRLEELYGASLNINVSKRGERQIIRFTIEYVSDQYLHENMDIKVITFLYNFLFDPLIIDGGFREDIVDREKINLKKRIKAKISNKRSYAIERLISEMCKGEAYSMPSMGNLDLVDMIDREKLYKHYLNLVGNSQLHLFLSGTINDQVKDFIANKFGSLPIDSRDIKREEIILPKEGSKEIIDRLDVNQGKLVLGYRSSIRYEDKDFSSFFLGNIILGGTASSKLFEEVREKNSLAYYISSRIEKYKSLLIIDGGIDFKNYKRTLELINENLDKMKRGEIRQEELDIAKKTVKNSLELIEDSHYNLTDFYFGEVLSGENREAEDIIKQIEEVSIDSISKAFSKLELDTIYFMDRDR